MISKGMGFRLLKKSKELIFIIAGLCYLGCMNLLLLAIAPGIAICLYIYVKDQYNREPPKYLLICFLLGILSAVAAAIIESVAIGAFESYIDHSLPVFISLLLQAFVFVAFTEEFCKFTVLKKYAFPKTAFDEPFDGIVYSIMVSMGFATIENIAYVFEHGFETGVIRMFLSVPAHGCFAVLMGYYAGLAKFNPQNSGALLTKGLLLAVLFHGMFDGFLFLAENDTVTEYVSGGMLVIGGLASYIIAIRLSLKSIKLHTDLSEKLYNGKEDSFTQHY
jgi:protease PrsW